MKKGLRLADLLELTVYRGWRWCPNEEGIKTIVVGLLVMCRNVGGGALMKKGLRPQILTIVAGPCRWRWCPNEEGIKTKLVALAHSDEAVGGGALMKKGLRRACISEHMVSKRLEVVP